MRVAVLYDVHGNLPALEAVLAEVVDARRRRDPRRRRRRCGARSRASRSTGWSSSARSSCAGTPTASRRVRRRASGTGSPSASTAVARVPARAPARALAGRRPLLPRLAARRRRDPDARLAGRAVPGRARRRGGAARRRRAHARPVRPRDRRDPLRERGERRHALRGPARRVLGGRRRRPDRAPAHAVRGRRGRRWRSGRRATRRPTSSASCCSSPRTRTRCLGVLREHCLVASSTRRAGASGRRRDRIRPIIERLAVEHADARIALRFRNELELLVSVMLSAQTTDVNVNRVTEHLFEKYRRPEDYLAVPAGGARARRLRDRLLPPEGEVAARDDAGAAGGVRRARAADDPRAAAAARASRARPRTSSRPSSATRRASSSTRTSGGSRSAWG